MTRREAAVAAVEQLLAQYQEYAAMSQELATLKTSRVQAAGRLAAATSRPLREIMTAAADYPELVSVDREAAAVTARQQALSDAMTFDDPIIWIRYKYLAYAGTSTAIVTMDDLRAHCSRVDYICTKRFTFLREWLRTHEQVDLADTQTFAPDMPLPELYDSELLERVASNADFMARWRDYEYHLDNGRVAKWENYSEDAAI